MISICIPLYNFDATGLIVEIHRQMETLSIPCELILIDDHSDNSYKEYYRTIAGEHRYIELPQNVGRSRIRNLFLQYATHPYLLFLDCDSIIHQSDFLQNYVSIISEQPDIVCGGRIYPVEKPDKNHQLRWYYGIKRESKTCQERQKEPNRSFMTNNFMIKRELLDEIRFDERLTKYGHEDTLFGLELAKKGITITHIENPVLNGDIESNGEFLRKTEEGVQNLVKILQFNQDNKHLIDSIALLTSYQKIRWATPIIKPIFNMINSKLRQYFENGGRSIKWFSIYKIGIYIIQTS
jgi:glycosyltransferase involved in cell wall biosynthesis